MSFFASGKRWELIFYDGAHDIFYEGKEWLKTTLRDFCGQFYRKEC